MIDDKTINKAIGGFLSGELKKRRITYPQLAIKLKAHGLQYSAASIATKIHRGTFSATFYLQCLMVIGYDSTEVTEIKKIITE